MDKRPLFLGRGRGRGRPTQQSSAATQLQTRGRGDGATWNSANVSQGGKSLTGAEVSKERLEKADKIKESVKKYIATANDGLEDSSEDDEINDDEILNKTLKNYRETPQGMNILRVSIERAVTLKAMTFLHTQAGIYLALLSRTACIGLKSIGAMFVLLISQCPAPGITELCFSPDKAIHLHIIKL